MSLRSGSRDYYYAQLDRRFPGLKRRYIRQYGSRYECDSPAAQVLYPLFQAECKRLDIATRMPIFTPQPVQHNIQLTLKI